VDENIEVKAVGSEIIWICPSPLFWCSRFTFALYTGNVIYLGKKRKGERWWLAFQ